MRRLRNQLDALRRLVEADDDPKTYRIPAPRTIAGLPDAVSAAFWKLGDDQRGAPEQSLEAAQLALGGGALSHAIEHIGDLTNRMTKADVHGGGGYGYVKSKVKSVLGYGYPGAFGNEVAGNAKNNADHRKLLLSAYWAEAKAALQQYADAHAKLTVYNEAQWRAREAAVALGRMDWRAAFKHLEVIQSHLGSAAKWKDYAMKFNGSSDGAPAPFTG